MECKNYKSSNNSYKYIFLYRIKGEFDENYKGFAVFL